MAEGTDLTLETILSQEDEHVPACGHREGKRHDCDYVEWRNGHIARAEAQANEMVVLRADPSPESLRKWNRAFLKTMNEMCQTYLRAVK